MSCQLDKLDLQFLSRRNVSQEYENLLHLAQTKIKKRKKKEPDDVIIFLVNISLDEKISALAYE